MGGDCEECRKKRALQRHTANPRAPEAAPLIVHDVLRSPGRPLDAATRVFMESRFGHDFGRVRVHTDLKAAQSARAVNALAYTVGADIVFGSGQYHPEGIEGRRLLAHELVHTIQQNDVAQPTAAAHGTLVVSGPESWQEREASVHAERVIAGAAVAVRSGSAVTLQRQQPASKPTIPVPVVDELDPMVSVPDVPGVPSFLRGQTLKLSDVRKALDFLRGSSGEKHDDCGAPFIGFEKAEWGEFKGQCCRGHERSAKNCCPWQEIDVKENRCCTTGTEVNIRGTCVELPKAPPQPPVTPCLPPEKPTLLGGCCAPGQVKDRQGRLCMMIPEPQKPPPPPPPPPPPGPIEVFFKFDRPGVQETGAAALRASATAEGLKNFDMVVAALQANPALQVQLVGRASPEGTDEYNIALGGRRAEAVAAALADKGISSTRLADPPTSDLRAECKPIRAGLATCGRAGATGERDRQVLVRFFVPATS
jgi:hypothetical protein